MFSVVLFNLGDLSNLSLVLVVEDNTTKVISRTSVGTLLCPSQTSESLVWTSGTLDT